MHRIAARLGIPAIRLNSGRWKTIKSFDDLMKVKGAEPPLEGYNNDDAFRWVVESIRSCLPSAEKAGVAMALENPHRNTIPPMQRPSRLPRHRPSVSMRAGQPEARSGRSISEHGSCNVRKVSLLRATADTIFGEFDPLCREERRHCAGDGPAVSNPEKVPVRSEGFSGEILASSNS